MRRRLIALAVAAPLLAWATYIISPLVRDQSRNLRAIEKHLDTIRPQWKEFNSDPDFQFVELFAYTGGDGMFGAYGDVPSREHLNKLREFMKKTSPPRPIYIDSVNVLDRPSFELLKQVRNSQVEQAN